MAVLRSLKMTIPQEEVFRLLGYPPGRHPQPALTQAIDQQIAAANKLVQPAVVYDFFKVQHIDNLVVVLDGDYGLSVGAQAPEWQRVEYIALAVCTIGKGPEAQVSRLVRNGDISAAAFLDAAGSVATESLAEMVYVRLCHRARRMGLNNSSRTSPGHGEWPLSDQQHVFDLLRPERIGITLTHSFLMLPLKSVSFAIGLGKGFESKNDSPCLRCEVGHCAYRRRC